MGAPVRIGDVLADKYKVTRILGEGGMGVVVAAQHRELDELVALKFIHEEASSTSRSPGASCARRELPPDSRASISIVLIFAEHIALTTLLLRDVLGASPFRWMSSVFHHFDGGFYGDANPDYTG